MTTRYVDKPLLTRQLKTLNKLLDETIEDKRPKTIQDHILGVINMLEDVLTDLEDHGQAVLDLKPSRNPRPNDE